MSISLGLEIFLVEAAAEKWSRAGAEVAVGIGVAVGPGLNLPAAAMAAAADWMPLPWKGP